MKGSPDFRITTIPLSDIDSIELLSESEFLNDLDDIVRAFDKTTKLGFRNSEQLQHIKFGSERNNQPDLNILKGRLTLAGYVWNK